MSHSFSWDFDAKLLDEIGPKIKGFDQNSTYS